MRNLFPSYYNEANDNLVRSWDEAIFTFDTNSLLSIFEFGETTQNEWLAELEELKESNRLFLPYQVAYEYHLQLRSRKRQVQKDGEKYFIKPLEEIISNLEKLHESRHPLAKHQIVKTVTDPLLKSVIDAKENSKTSVEAWKKEYDTKFKICKERLADIFEGIVLKPPSKKVLRGYVDEAKGRISQKIPPGYKDSGKENSDYGNPYADVIIWFEILDFASSADKPIVLVTLDKKIDWFDKNAGKPRQELIDEMYSKAGLQFFLGNAIDFIKWFSKDKDSDGKEAIEEVEYLTFGSSQYFEILTAGTRKSVLLADKLSSTFHNLPKVLQDRILSHLIGMADLEESKGFHRISFEEDCILHVEDNPNDIVIQNIYCNPRRFK